MFSCGCSALGWYNLSLCIDKVLIFFHILVLRVFCVLTESRIPLKPVLESLYFPLVLTNRLHKIRSYVF